MAYTCLGKPEDVIDGKKTSCSGSDSSCKLVSSWLISSAVSAIILVDGPLVDLVACGNFLFYTSVLSLNMEIQVILIKCSTSIQGSISGKICLAVML